MTFDGKHDGRGDRKSACSLEILLRSASERTLLKVWVFVFLF